MMASNRIDQESENNIFSHSKQLLCAISDLANSCLIIYCHSHGQQAVWRHTHTLLSTVKATKSLTLHGLPALWPILTSEKDEEQNLNFLPWNRGVIFFPKPKGPDVLMVWHHMTPGLPRQAVNPVQLTLLVTALNSWGTHSLAPW